MTAQIFGMIFLCVGLMIQGPSSAAEHHEHEEEESTGGVGPHNAVTAADAHAGITLSLAAIECIGLATAVYDGQLIPKAALIFYQDKVGLYRLRDGWFKLVSADDLRPGDQIVVQGTGLLRVAELDAFSGDVGHSH